MKTRQDYVDWIENKIKVEFYHKRATFKSGEVWWFICGLNIGEEIDGKNEDFTDPF